MPVNVLRIMHLFEEQTVHKAMPGALLADLKNEQLLPHSLELARLAEIAIQLLGSITIEY